MQPQTEHAGPQKPDLQPYVKLGLSLALSFVIMYVSGFARTDRWSNVLLNLNQVYMAGLMVAPMALVMLVTMRHMFKHKTLNVGLAVASAALTVLFWTLVRVQAGVGDEAFLRSMIPHHAAAVLVCQEADLTDPRIQQLCREIIEAQEREIAEMKGYLAN